MTYATYRFERGYINVRECKDENVKQECMEFKDYRYCVDCEKILVCKGVCTNLTRRGDCTIDAMGKE